MINQELITELLLQQPELIIRLELIDHQDRFHYSPVYFVRVEKGSLVISGVPPEILANLDKSDNT